MPNGFRHTQRVEFRDTDAAGIAHFSAFFVWMEEAEHAALRGIGLSVLPRPTDESPAVITWPRVSAHCDFRAPAHFEDELQIDVCVRKLGDKSVTYEFQFSTPTGPIATGLLTTVCCRRETSGELTSIAIPPDIRSKLELLR